MYKFILRSFEAEMIVRGGEKEEKAWRGARYLST
jgi:hypothetical protein